MEQVLIDDVVRAIAAVGVPDESGGDLWREAAADPRAYERSGNPAHFTASALPMTADGRRVCLVLHRLIGLWVQPGGHLEAGDLSVGHAAARELLEETGLVGSVSEDPLVLSRHAAPCGQAVWHLDLQMLAVVAEVEPVVSAESTDVAWFESSQLPSDAASGVAELVDRAAEFLSRSGSRARPGLPG